MLTNTQLLLCLLSLLLFVGAGCDDRSPPPTLEQNVYVWQRQWHEGVSQAVRSVEPDISTITPLVAELHYPENGKLSIVDVAIDTAALTSSNKKLTAGIRIPYPRRWDDDSTATILEAIEALAKRYPEFESFQIDYDSPQSKLTDYAYLLQALSKRFGKKQISFTALPAWLDDLDQFKALTEHCSYFVLQVHWVDTSGGTPILIDPDAAKRYVERANKIDCPYQVALPTYGSFVIYNESGKVKDVVSEDLPSKWPNQSTAKLAWSSPAEMAELVNYWQTNRPSNCYGISWYRLPVKSDLLNWPKQTFAKVRKGFAPKQHWKINQKRQSDGLITLHLENSGEQPEPQLPATIALSSSNGSFSVADGIGLYRISKKEPNKLEFQIRQQPHDHLPLPVGKSFQIGWLRSTGDHLDVEISL